jgi:hypothetical protein
MYQNKRNKPYSDELEEIGAEDDEFLVSHLILNSHSAAASSGYARTSACTTGNAEPDDADLEGGGGDEEERAAAGSVRMRSANSTCEGS